MPRAYEILCDPADRYLVWDVEQDAPVVSADRIVTFGQLAESRRFLETMQPAPSRMCPPGWDVVDGGNERRR